MSEPRMYCTGCRHSRVSVLLGGEGPDSPTHETRYACAHPRVLEGLGPATALPVAGERYVGSTDLCPSWCPLNRGGRR